MKLICLFIFQSIILKTLLLDKFYKNILNEINVVSFEFFSFSRNGNNKLTDGTCCNISEKGKSLCSGCFSTIYILEKGEKEDIHKVVEIKNNVTVLEDYKSIAIKVNRNKPTSFYLYHSTENLSRIYDSWKGPDSNFYGPFWLNGVYGEYYQTKIMASFYVYTSSPNTAIRSLYFYYTKLTWINRKYASDSKCCFDSESSKCEKACFLNLETYIGKSKIWVSGRVGYEGTDDVNFIKTGGSTTNDQAFRENITLTINFVQNDNSIMIDQIEVKDLNFMPNDEIVYKDMSGKYGNLKLSFILRFDCAGYSGKNCKFNCDSNNGLVGCRNDNGKRFCINGSPNIPECDQVTSNTCNSYPCENDGKCISLPNTFICHCKKGYKGRYCQIPTCKFNCHLGSCDSNNNCICNQKYFGDFCDESDCTEAESRKCHPKSKCLRIKDVATCICKEYSSGNTCHTPVCEPKCQNNGKCVWNNDEDINKPVKCVCTSIHSGDLCNIKTLTYREYRPTAIIISLILTAITTLFLLKFLIILVFGCFFNKSDQVWTSVYT